LRQTKFACVTDWRKVVLDEIVHGAQCKKAASYYFNLANITNDGAK